MLPAPRLLWPASGRTVLKRLHPHRWLAVGAAVVLSASAASATDSPGLRSSPTLRPIITAIGHGDCAEAVKAGNAGVTSGDPQVMFLLGRMVDEGICTPQDRIAAASFFAQAVELGDTGAALAYATKIGLGEGVQQSYERAGELCRSGGLDPAGRMSRYSLGYACTLAGLTAELLRTTLPRGAFRSGALRVEFTPGTGAMQIRSTPIVGYEEATTGSNVRHPLVDGPRAISRAWNNAVAQAPKPDTGILDKLPIEMPLDVDTVLESAGLRNGSSQGTPNELTAPLLPGSFMRTKP